MALSAIGAELAGVHVTRAMTADAARFELLSGDDSGVTRMTGNFLVTSFERPLRIARVIEAGGEPLVLAVARAALLAESTRVRIFTAMAAVAVTGQRVFQPATFVAISAVEPRMSAFQREPRLLRVIKLRRLPARRRMTVIALRAALAAMHVIRGMAGRALLWRALVTVFEVTGEARDVLVLVPQWERRLVVIEVDPPPGNTVVAAPAIVPELTRVRLLLAMARVAIGRRFAEAFPFHVTAIAGYRDMCPLQGEVGARVIELVAAQLDDVGVATEMFGVARLALK